MARSSTSAPPTAAPQAKAAQPANAAPPTDAALRTDSALPTDAAPPTDPALPTDTESGRAPRRDAARNREALLVAASAAYAVKGTDASLEDIARQAGVGIGTLYRHFPNRDALNEAIYRREVEMLCGGVDELLRDRAPIDALSIWMQRFAGYVARKRGMATALKSALGTDSSLFTDSRRRIVQALELLVTAAVEHGDIARDTDPDDLLGGMSGICMAGDAQSAERTERLIGLLVDGLRYRAAEPG